MIILAKKGTFYAERSEKDREEYQQEIADVPMNRRIYVDESGLSSFFHRERAWSPRGTKVCEAVPGKKFARTNVVAGLCNGKILGEYCYTGTTTSLVFENWFCDFLLPETVPGDVVIMDRASFHNKQRLRLYAEGYGVRVVFLPAYSPDYNDIENVWANMKRFLKNVRQKFTDLQSGIYWYFAMEFS